MPPLDAEGTTLADVIEVLDAFDRAGIRCWLEGGWGVDALVGHRTRRHRDVDVDIDAADEVRALDVLRALGYEPWADCRPNRIELLAGASRYVDLHPLLISPDGSARQPGPNGELYDFPASYFTTGSLDGRPVGCFTALAQRRFRTGYQLRAVDRHDLAVLDQLELDAARGAAVPAAPADGHAGSMAQDERTGAEPDAAQREIDLESRETNARIVDDRQAAERSDLTARELRADRRDSVADARDDAADRRQARLDRRQSEADERDRVAAASGGSWLDQREIDLERRESQARIREQAVTARETALRLNEEAAGQIQVASRLEFEQAERGAQSVALRETAVNLRERALEERERAADRREHLADLRQAGQDERQARMDESSAAGEEP